MRRKKCLIFNALFVIFYSPVYAQYAPKQVDGAGANNEGNYLRTAYRSLIVYSDFYKNSKQSCINYIRFGAPDIKKLDELVFNTVPKITSDLSRCYKRLVGVSLNETDSGYNSFVDSQTDVLMNFASKNVQQIPKNKNQLNLCPTLQSSIEFEIDRLRKLTGYPEPEWCNNSRGLK